MYSILEEALQITNVDRQKEYGDPVEGFNHIATIASILTGKELTAIDCCLVLKAVKLVREKNKSKRDNLTDECGYTRLESVLKGYETLDTPKDNLPV